MNDMRPFLQEVLDRPDVDEPRLIYADWLEEQGDPRGEFIRAQCQLELLSETDEEYYDALERSDRLLSQHANAWAAELAQDVKKSRFRRGFIEEVTALASSIVKDQGALFSKAPIQWLRLNRVKGKGQQLADLPTLVQLRGLDVSGIQIPEEDFVALFASPYLTGLTRFRSFDYSAQPKVAEMQAIVESVAANSLTYLSVADDVSLTGLQAGAGFPNLETLQVRGESTFLFEQDLHELKVPRLKSLLLDGVECNATSIDYLRSIPWDNLERLEICCADEGQVVAKLMHVGAFQNLRSLKISQHEDSAPKLQELFEDPSQLTHCQSLEIELRKDFSNEQIFPTAGVPRSGYIQRIAEAAHLQNLRRLSLSHLGRGDLKRLAQAPHLDHLAELSLNHSTFSSEDGEAFLFSPMRESLKCLSFLSANFEPGFTAALAQGSFPQLLSLNFGRSFMQVAHLSMEPIFYLVSQGSFDQLRKLGIDWAGAAGEELERLARQVVLPELRVLSFQHNQCTQASAKAILGSGAFPRLAQFRLGGSMRTKNLDKFNKKFDFKVKLDSDL